MFTVGNQQQVVWNTNGSLGVSVREATYVARCIPVQYYLSVLRGRCGGIRLHSIGPRHHGLFFSDIEYKWIVSLLVMKYICNYHVRIKNF